MKKSSFLIILLSLTVFIYPSFKDSATNILAQTNDSIDLLNNINITVNVEQELFPVIAKFLSEGNEHSAITDLVVWNFSNNNSDSVQISVICVIPEWTSPIISTLQLAPNESKQLAQTPFGIKLLSNDRTIPTTILLTVKLNREIIFEETRNLNIRSADDMIWSLATSFDTAELIAAWVTPNDEMVESLLAFAKQSLYNHSLAGYNSADLVGEIRAIFNAVRKSKVSYVDSHMSFGQIGFTQRVRLPNESINQRSANCIDGAVLFASLFENIGLEPIIVLIPGHAFVGVRLEPNSQQTLFIETTIVGRSSLNSILTLQKTFDAAVEAGYQTYADAMQSDPNNVHIIDIKNAREMGIYPLW
jgi:hypothetical protein